MRPFSNFGAVIINAEMNWLETLPEILTSPPFIFPEIDIGGLPLDELHFASNDSRASSSGCIGLFLRLESPVKNILSLDRVEMAVAILIVVPELAASIVSLCSFSSPVLFTVMSFPTSFISAPKFLHALIVEYVSPDFKMFLIMLLPSDNVAKKIALCV